MPIGICVKKSSSSSSVESSPDTPASSSMNRHFFRFDLAVGFREIFRFSPIDVSVILFMIDLHVPKTSSSSGVSLESKFMAVLLT